MRDPNRIDGYIEKLKKIWKRFPDWRFGQLILNLFSSQKMGGADLFYMEDTEMFRKIEETIDEWTNKKGEK